MSKRPALRPYEWVLAIYFSYVAAISPWFHLLPWIEFRPAILAIAAILLLVVLAYAESRETGTAFSITRDWTPLLLTLFAYREMNWFTPLHRDYHLEFQWVKWDRLILHDWGLQRAIESLGVLIPAYLELCYLLVYAVGPFAIATLYFLHRRDLVNHVVLLYLIGTLCSYALFPFFPSEPPRSIFGASDLPNVITPLRPVNLWMLGGYGIHSSVFPSAHVSSAFSAAWALILFLPEKKKWIGWGMLIYAASVALAVVYGRYHYGVDSLAGFGVSLAPLIVGKVILATDKHR